MESSISIQCEKLGEIDVPAKNAVIVNFVRGYNGDDIEPGGLALSAGCPCCKHSHVYPITDEFKKALVSRGVQIVQFNRSARGNVPDSRSRLLFGSLFERDPINSMKIDLKEFEIEASRPPGVNAPSVVSERLLLAVDRWSRSFERDVARSMQNRTTPMSWRNIDSR